MNNKYELLAPAGDLERLKVALLYGADAVFIGGQHFSLRSRASNFTLDDIKEGCSFAHRLNKKVYVTCNIVMHEEDAKNIEEYLKQLDAIGVDAIITSSVYMAQIAIKKTNLHVHISTQCSILNIKEIEFFKSIGCQRVVLGRECSLDNIIDITKEEIAEIEVFIHGGMCSSYSGKCMLSNVMTNRDANRGGCAHSCRWKYDIFDKNNNKLNPDNTYFSMSSKDLCALSLMPEMLKANIDSFKIEGRMKSLNYIACVCKAYRLCIDDYLNGQPFDLNKYYNVIKYCENRDTGIGFLKGNISVNEQLFILDNECKRTGEFVGIVKDYDKKTKLATIYLRNKIMVNKDYLVFSPKKEDRLIHINKFIVNNNDNYESYSVANDLISFECEETLEEFDIIRLKL